MNASIADDGMDDVRFSFLTTSISHVSAFSFQIEDGEPLPECERRKKQDVNTDNGMDDVSLLLFFGSFFSISLFFFFLQIDGLELASESEQRRPQDLNAGDGMDEVSLVFLSLPGLSLQCLL
jgi:hypothetical protein